MSETIIQLDHIDITFYQKKRVVEAVTDVSVNINRGDIYGIVGYSGAVPNLIEIADYSIGHYQGAQCTQSFSYLTLFLLCLMR